MLRNSTRFLLKKASDLPIFTRRYFYIFKKDSVEDELSSLIEISGKDIQEANQFASATILKGLTPQQANLKCNELIAEKIDFREKCQAMVQQHMARTTPIVSWGKFSARSDWLPGFRSVAPYGDYGLPSNVFQYGMPAAMFNMRQHTYPLSEAKIVTYVVQQQTDDGVQVALSIKDRHDMHGFTLGPVVGVSLNVAYAALQRYTFTSMRFQRDNYLYLVAVDQGYSAADAIHHGTGFSHNRDKGLSGHKGVSNAEDAREVTPGVYISSQHILGCRLVKTTGELGPFIPNPSADLDVFVEMQRFIDVRIFLNSESVQEIKRLEAAMYPEIHHHEDVRQRMLEVNDLNQETKRQIQMEAVARREGVAPVCTLLRSRQAGSPAFFCESSYSLLQKSQGYVAAKRNGELLDAKDDYDSRKAKSEEALRERAINRRQSTK